MKQKKYLEEELKNNCISLRKFLMIYCGVDDEILCDLTMSHKDIKKLIPDLKRISFEKLYSDMRSLYVGDVIVVKDSYGNIAPYVCPKLEEILVPKIMDYKNDEEEIENLILNSDLKSYELSIICKKLKAYKKFKEYRIANNLLKSKIDIKGRQYKKEKYNLRKKEKENEY